MPPLLLGTALTLTALGLVPGAAHLMELPVKMTYSPQLYARVTSTLYVWFGVAGGAVQVGAVVFVGLLAWRTRRLPEGRLVAVSAAALVISLMLWAALVLPVNLRWGEALRSGDAVAAYDGLRSRWEYGHVAAFCAWCTGWLGLVTSVMRLATPRAYGPV